MDTIHVEGNIPSKLDVEENDKYNIIFYLTIMLILHSILTSGACNSHYLNDEFLGEEFWPCLKPCTMIDYNHISAELPDETRQQGIPLKTHSHTVSSLLHSSRFSFTPTSPPN